MLGYWLFETCRVVWFELRILLFDPFDAVKEFQYRLLSFCLQILAFGAKVLSGYLYCNWIANLLFAMLFYLSNTI